MYDLEKGNENLSHHLTIFLTAMGFQLETRGTQNVKQAIIIFYNDENASLGSACKTIAGATKMTNEHNIQSAMKQSITTAFNQTAFKPLERAFGVEMFYGYPPPIRKFVALVAEYLRVFWDGRKGLDYDLFGLKRVI